MLKLEKGLKSGSGIISPITTIAAARRRYFLNRSTGAGGTWSGISAACYYPDELSRFTPFPRCRYRAGLTFMAGRQGADDVDERHRVLIASQTRRDHSVAAAGASAADPAVART